MPPVRPASASPPAQVGPATDPADDPEGSGLRPGALTALLQQIAAVPEEESGARWSSWLLPGAVVGRFEMVREVGRGGFGVVWEARDRELGRRVAFKAVRASGSVRIHEERLLREAEAAARLAHPNIVTLYDVGRTEQGPYLVLELLEGETLADRLARGRLPARETLRIAVEIARGVAHAHARGVVHRDLKPANVLLCSDGQVKVLDFGMAHAFGREREKGGTPAYMAPEQWAGDPEDERTDVFALGTMLFELFAGGRPFSPDAPGRPPRFERGPPDLEVAEAPTLGPMVGRMLATDPARRPRSGGEVLAELSQAQALLDLTTGTRLAALEAGRRPSLRVAAWLAAAAVLAAGVATLSLRNLGPRPAAGERILVAVADFANDTRDPDLDGLSGLLITSLEQSRSLRVLTRSRMADLVRELGQGDALHIDESLARAAGRRAGVKALLLASIRKIGDTYAAELRALDPQRDEYLFTLREQAATKADLLALIDRISDRTRLALNEPASEVTKSGVEVAQAVTPSLEAYRHYFRGSDLAARGALSEAVAEFRRAVEVEPHFALAQANIAWIGYFSGDVSRVVARDLVRQAARDAARAPDKEAGLIRILSAFFDGRFAASRAEIRAVTTRFPDDRDVMVLAATIGAWCGDFEGAALHFDRALRLAPDWDLLRIDQVAVLSTLGRIDEAYPQMEAAARERGTPTARVAAGLAAFAKGDLDRGLEAIRASGADDVATRAFLAQGLAAQGRIEEALATVAEFDSVVADLTQAQVLAYAGRLREGVAKLDHAARRPGVDVAFNRQVAAWYLAAAGETEKAREMADRGEFFMVLDGPMLAAIGDDERLGELLAQLGTDSLYYARFLRALAAHRAGATRIALAELRALDRGESDSPVPYFHGAVAAQLGRDDEAVEAFRRFEHPVAWASVGYEKPWFLARSRFLMARSLGRLGRRDEARRVLDAQLGRWKDADRDLPLLAEMKALRARLDRAHDSR